MKRILGLVVAIAMTACLGDANAQAQDYLGGYQFGAGIRSQCNAGGFSRFDREQPPYFAKYPPVYYSHVVKRPYGISPYAAPAGIAPVEMSTPIPLSVKNPYFQREIETVSDKIESSVEDAESTTEATTQQTTWIQNPHVVAGDTSLVLNRLRK